MAEPDAELVARALGGQRPAFAELVHRHVGWVGAVAAGVLGDFAAARDVACESFRRAFVSLAKLPDRRRFPPWLYTITQRTALDWLRGQQDSQPTTTMPSVGETEPDPRQRVLAEILALPPHYRESLLLHAIGGCSCEDVARLGAGTPADAAARRARAQQALAVRLSGGRIPANDERAAHVLRYLDETMAAAERADLERQMAESPDLRLLVEAVRKGRALAAEALRDHPFDDELAEAAIRQLPEFAQEATELNIRTRVGLHHRRAFVAALVAVAAGAAAAAALLSRRAPPPVARPGDAETAAQAGLSLKAGSWVRPQFGSNLMLRVGTSSHLVVRGSSSLLLQQSRALYLARGEMWVEATGEREPLVLTAPVGRVTCLAAELILQSGEEQTRVAVRRGRASVQAGGKTLDLHEGQIAVLARAKAPAVSAMGESDPGYLFGWADEFLGRSASKATPAQAAQAPPPAEPAPELPRQNVLAAVTLAEGRSSPVLGLHGLLTAAGAKLSYACVAGLSGDPFRFFYSPAGGYYGANLYVENPLRVACELLGYRIERTSGRPWADGWVAIRRTLAAGRPVLLGADQDPRIAYPTMEWLLIYGYDLDRDSVLFHALNWPELVRRNQETTLDSLQDAHTNYNGANLEPDFPTPPPQKSFPFAPQYRVAAGAPDAKAPARPVAILTALARARAYAESKAVGKALDADGRPVGEARMGLAAFEAWMSHVRTGAGGEARTAESRDAIAGFGDPSGIPRFGWPLVLLKMARRDAADFLTEAAADFEGETQKELAAAAGVYRDIGEDLASLAAAYPSAKDEAPRFTAACARAVILIESLRQKETAALRHLTRALGLEAARGRKPLPVPTFNAP